LSGTASPFAYNDTKGFLGLIDKHKNSIGVIVLESIRNHQPEREFIETVRQVANDLGAVMVFDEITAGWRLNMGGAHLLFKVDPDIAVFGKAISNGFPQGVVVGKRDVMESAQDSFISSTYWTERIGPAASIATIKKLKEKNVPDHLIKIGQKIQEGWKSSAAKHQLKIKVSGIYPLGHFAFDSDKPLVLKTLFTQFMLDRGFLATNGFYASYAHKDEHVEMYLEAVDETFSFIAGVVEDGTPEKYLKGPVCHSGFKRLA
jgi:glutamate-1-semialdehyde aminotransferase